MISITDSIKMDLKSDKPFSGKDFLKAELSTLLIRNRSLGQQVSINVGINTLATTNEDDYGWNALSGVTGTLGSSAISFGMLKSGISPKLNRMIVPIGAALGGEYFGDTKNLKYQYQSIGDMYAQ